MTKTHCGNCSHFKYEDVNGFGWCEIYEVTVRCNMMRHCTNHKNKEQ